MSHRYLHMGFFLHLDMEWRVESKLVRIANCSGCQGNERDFFGGFENVWKLRVSVWDVPESGRSGLMIVG